WTLLIRVSLVRISAMCEGKRRLLNRLISTVTKSTVDKRSGPSWWIRWRLRSESNSRGFERPNPRELQIIALYFNRRDVALQEFRRAPQFLFVILGLALLIPAECLYPAICSTIAVNHQHHPVGPVQPHRGSH